MCKKAKEDRELENNPKLFKYFRGVSYQRFHGKHKGKDFCVYVPDNHPALNNILFNDGWGTNSEIGEFYLLEGIEEPTELHYWNVEKQEMEIVSEEKVEQFIQEDKRIFYEKFVSLEENITIDYFTDRERERERAILDQFKWLLKLFGNHDVRSLINLLTFN